MIFIGASGHAKVIHGIAHELGRSVDVFYDDNDALVEFLEIPVRVPIDYTLETEVPAIISIGSNRARKAISSRWNGPFGVLQHPRSTIAHDVELGEGSVAMAGSIVNPAARVGRHVILNTGCTVDHDCVLEDFVHICPNATLAGNVTVGEGTQVGAGAVVIQGVRIGRWAMIGAGAVVIRDVPDGVTVVGNPARILNT